MFQDKVKPIDKLLLNKPIVLLVIAEIISGNFPLYVQRGYVQIDK